MASWAQRLDAPGSRVDIPHVTTIDTTWERDSAQTYFEGRAYPVTARTGRLREEWTVTAAWGIADRPDAEAYLTLLRDTALSTDTRLEVHFEPANGTHIDAVVLAVDVPQGLGAGRTDATVTFRRVE